MRNPHRLGDTRTYTRVVGPDAQPTFQGQVVHAVYATYALAQDAEWACRLFVLDMLEEGEEGIGTALTVNHCAPAPLGAEVQIVARLEAVLGNCIDCSYTVLWGQRTIATGSTQQKIIQKARFDALLHSLGQQLRA